MAVTYTVLEHHEVAAYVARQTVWAIKEAVSEYGEANILLTGGSSIHGVYDLMSQADIPWEKVSAWLSDERLVGLNAPDSNYGLAKGFFDQLAIYLPPHEALLEDQLQVARPIPERIDVSLLSVGSDGHIASLFPEAEQEWQEGLVIQVDPGMDPRIPRITMTPAVLTRARRTYAIVLGEAKREALRSIKGRSQGRITPARAILPTLPEAEVVTDLK